MKKVLLFVVVAIAACGGKKSEPVKPVVSEMKPDTGDKDKHAMSPELMKFHGVLSPRWHADKGEKRMKDTCAAIADFQANADALVKAAAPAGMDAAKWSSGTKELTDAVAALGATCKANDAAAFETAFHRVHVGFHGLIGEEDEHGEHHEGGEHKM